MIIVGFTPSFFCTFLKIKGENKYAMAVPDIMNPIISGFNPISIK